AVADSSWRNPPRGFYGAARYHHEPARPGSSCSGQSRREDRSRARRHYSRHGPASWTLLQYQTSARFWINAQAAYDLEVAQDALQRNVERDVRPRAGFALS